MSNQTAHQPLTITGQIVIATTVRPLSSATIHVYLEDVSFADAPASAIAQIQLVHVNHPTDATNDAPTVLPFVIRLDTKSVVIEPTADYSLRVWVDADGDGQPGAGDLFSDQSYPVLTHGFGTSAVITVE